MSHMEQLRAILKSTYNSIENIFAFDKDISEMGSDPRKDLQEADNALKSASSGFSFFAGREEKYEKAVSLYKKAANGFRLQMQGSEAGRTYERVAQIELDKLKEENDAANSWMEAAKCYQMDHDADNAVRLLKMATDFFLAKGNIRRGATQQAAMAKIVKEELNDPARCAKEYEKAGQLFNMDGNASATVSNNWNEAAHQFALAGDYAAASNYFEQISRMARDSNTLKYSIPKWLLWSAFCYFAVGDHVAIRRALDGYYSEFGQEFDPQRTQQCGLLEDLFNIMTDDRGADPERWGSRLGEWNSSHPMDNWEVEICTRVRKQMEEQGEDFS